MTATESALSNNQTELHTLEKIFATQKDEFRRAGVPSAHRRIAHLRALAGALRRYQDKLADAISEDYGHRSADEFKMAELMFTLEGIKYCQKHVRQWMRPEKRHVSSLNRPGTARVEYQPLGVVGIIVPWNYPIFLAAGPLTYALAAGNRVMIKMSGYTPRLGKVFQQMIAEIFPENQVAVINGRGPVSAHFPKLPFNQITFTGSTDVGKIVMAEAARNLTPVLLELGGKSPTIVHESYPLDDAAERIALGKCWNAGQTCVAPDHLYLPRGKSSAFIAELRTRVAKMYASLKDNPDYTSIINEKQYNRLQGYLEDARQRGATVIELNPGNETFSGTRKMPITVVTGVTDEMELMKHEIFGPILPIMEYDDISSVIERVNAAPHPLALYYFDYDRGRADALIAQTWSGGATVNDVMTHVVIDDLPFGGVGPAGMGRYHGKEGFRSMSNAKGVLVKSRLYPMRLILPPFNKASHEFIRRFILK